jgi:hypothetical protein
MTVDKTSTSKMPEEKMPTDKMPVDERDMQPKPLFDNKKKGTR